MRFSTIFLDIYGQLWNHLKAFEQILLDIQNLFKTNLHPLRSWDECENARFFRKHLIYDAGKFYLAKPVFFVPKRRISFTTAEVRLYREA